MNWFHTTRLRVFAVMVAIILAAIGVITWAALPVVPVLGVALITVAAVVNQMTARLDYAVCFQCGGDLDAQKPGVYGVICPGCGAVNEAVPREGDGLRAIASGKPGGVRTDQETPSA